MRERAVGRQLRAGDISPASRLSLGGGSRISNTIRYSPGVRLHRWIPYLLVLALAAGCPKSPKRTRTLPDVPTTGDATARARFQEARARFERDGGEVTAADFER